MKSDTIKLTFKQWDRLGFLVKKGSKGIKIEPFGATGHYYVFTEDQVVRKKDPYEGETTWASESDLY